jgi:hypothetical protein
MSNSFILDETLFSQLILLVIIVAFVYVITKSLHGIPLWSGNMHNELTTTNNYKLDVTNVKDLPEINSSCDSCSMAIKDDEDENNDEPPRYPSFPDKSYPKYTNPVVYERDRLELEDPLYPPEQRSDNDIENRYLQMAYNGYFRNPTRGYPPPYQMKGYLVQDDNDTNVLSLFGRPKYVGSTQYDYYFTRNDINNNQIKLPIKHQRELLDGDMIKLNTGIYNGEYKYVALPVEDLIQPPI